MPNTGRVKLLTRSQLLSSDGADAMASSGGDSVSNLLSFDRTGYWQSDDEQDGTASTININFNQITSISRLLIVDTNVKTLNIRLSAVPLNVIDIDNLPVASLAPYNNTNPAIYLEFDPILVNSLEIQAVDTQVPNQRKYIRPVSYTHLTLPTKA